VGGNREKGGQNPKGNTCNGGDSRRERVRKSAIEFCGKKPLLGSVLNPGRLKKKNYHEPHNNLCLSFHQGESGEETKKRSPQLISLRDERPSREGDSIKEHNWGGEKCRREGSLRQKKNYPMVESRRGLLGRALDEAILGDVGGSQRGLESEEKALKTRKGFTKGR